MQLCAFYSPWLTADYTKRNHESLTCPTSIQDTWPTAFCWRQQKNSISGLTRHYQSFSKAGPEPVAWPCLCRDSEGSPSLEGVHPCVEHHRRGLQPRAPPLRDGESTWWAGGVVVWGWNPGELRKEGSPGCFEGGVAELGWAPAAGLAWSPPTAGKPEPCGSCYHLPPWIICRISPPFSPPADVLWLRFRKITTPILDTDLLVALEARKEFAVPL